MVGAPSKFTKDEAYVAFAFSQFAYFRGLNVHWAFEIIAGARGLSEKSYESVRRVIHGTGSEAGCSGYNTVVVVESWPGSSQHGLQTMAPVLPETGELVEEAWRIDKYANMVRWNGARWEPYLPQRDELGLIPGEVLRKYLDVVGSVRLDDLDLKECAATWSGFGELGFDNPTILKAWMDYQAEHVRAQLEKRSAQS